MVYTQDNNSKGKLYIRSCEHLSQLNWFQCVGVPKCSNANFTFSNLCITPSWTAIVWSYTLEFIFLLIVYLLFLFKFWHFFLLLLDILFDVEFVVLCWICCFVFDFFFVSQIQLYIGYQWVYVHCIWRYGFGNNYNNRTWTYWK